LLKPGDPAPEFEALSHIGEPVRLDDYRGRNVVLWFYPKADTPGCTIEGKGFRDGIHDLEARNAVVMGVSFDTVDENAAFAEKFSFPFLLLSDPGREIGLAYHAADRPDQEHARRITYVVDPEGRIAHALEQVDVRTHAADVARLL
jgi:peroxiredoxin Q/BCP